MASFVSGLVNNLTEGGAVSRCPGIDEKMSPQQLSALLADPLFSLGAHGTTHRILGRLTDSEWREEVTDSVAFVREVLEGARGPSASEASKLCFAYPEGHPGSFSQAMADHLRKVGVSGAFTTLPSPVVPDDDPMTLGRYLLA